MSRLVERTLAVGCTLGEGPVWDAARECLWFTDIKQHRIHSFDPARGLHESHLVHDQVGWVLPAKGGKLLAGLKDGLHLFDPATGKCARVAEVAGEPAGNRLNDACADSRGRVFFGSMDDGESAASGRFYRAHEAVVTPMGPDAVCITNGPAIGPGDRRIYFSDTAAKKILVADLDADGNVDEARLFADTARDFPDAYPDGPTCDAEGCVWTGLWNGWGVARYSPKGELLEKVDIPAANVTKLAFGGPDRKRAFVTTARKGLDEAALAAQPMAGDIFAFDVEVPGLVAALAEFRA
ncbi:SMP-30/gluconolactonase/LRE family protein [Novosphingobium cyanobacteriorum]|uniref:SMP-30/gluconolactonase/LRE family protein n=1 Tax=Novosphingobium cyanobacteriorum TaxID=3024215 RepID=A0ABT6CG02_9SPHN|nr:SMP-30/gluconolactonase/LRE family protein [Novosphingobium cyanobacteriorum]MDF8332757.1 SMP-30/gluconolactonase/LRE family protein [Novosphingobium cyanobacteriorum]